MENFKDFVIPADKRLWKKLNEEYRNAELNYDYPTQNSKVFVENPILQEYYRKQVHYIMYVFLNIRVIEMEGFSKKISNYYSLLYYQVPLYKKDHQSMLKKLRQSNSEVILR